MNMYNKKMFLLRDRHCIRLSLIGPNDRQRLLNGFEKISSRTNISRFHTFKNSFTEAELQYLLVVDNVNHLALGAIDCQQPDVGIGLARYVRDEQKPESAEAAIIVIDEYQKKGLGRLLYHGLMHLAQQNGIRYLENSVGKDNRNMLSLLAGYGGSKYSEDTTTYTIVVDTSNSLQGN